MAPENNWLSFSLSSMEMLNSSSQSSMLQSNLNSSSAASHQYYFADNFYPHGWSNPKPQVIYSEGENHVNEVTRHNMNNNSFGFQGYMDSQIHQQSQPKLEDFLGNDFRYSDSQTDTQDSSLTHIYHDHQDLKSIAAGFQTFSTNSGSEVEDSASVGRTTQVMGGDQFIESGNELGFSQCATGALSLAVNNTHSSQKAVVAVESESCKKISDTFGQRTSIYRGVTRHRWTGRYEAHLWDNSCKREGQARKGRQVYLGGYDKEDKAARAYDLAALKYWGSSATTNLPVSNYSKELEEMKHMTKQEFIASLRRKSSGFSRGASKYRGVTRHHQQGRWQARIGRVAGNKDLYLGTFATEEEAAEAYDIAAIKFRGVNAVTNFEMNRYDVEAIMKSALPVGGAAKRLKLSLESEQKLSLCNNQQTQSNSTDNHNISFGAMPHVSPIPYGVPFDTAAPYYHHNFFHQLHTNNAGASDASGAITTMAAAMPTLNSPAELFFWPHQSY